MKFLLLRVDELNLNRRIYPKDIILEIINDEKFQNKLKTRQFVGFIGQPVNSFNLNRDIKDASHILTDIYLDGNNLFGEIEILDTPAGLTLLQNLKDGKVNFGMALNGVGDGYWNENDEFIVDSLEILSFDYVHNPSYRKKC